ncbi:MAG: SBBP repeat-containing protein, partial [Candidatus Acidiferrum sp.]
MADQNAQDLELVQGQCAAVPEHPFPDRDGSRVHRPLVCALVTGISLLVLGGLVQSQRWNPENTRQPGHHTLLNALASKGLFSWFGAKVHRSSESSVPAAWGYPATDNSTTRSLGSREGTTQPLLSYADLPLSFESDVNGPVGQHWFAAAGRGYRLSLFPQEAVLDLIAPSKNTVTNPPLTRHGRHSHFAVSHSDSLQAKNHSTLHLTVVNGSPNAQISGLEELPGKTLYFEGKDSRKWRTSVRNYARVQYRGIYPGVDLLYYGNQHQLEYDFIVAPGANPDQIRLSVSGASRVELDRQGNLLLATEQGEVLLRKPVVYQQMDNTRREVASNFRVEGQEVSFAVGDYDRSRQLVIDPSLNYATYLGRSVNDKVNAIGLGSDGSTYVAGIAPAMTSSGYDEAFVAHISADGKELLYMAYLGGTGATDARGIAVDASGNVYVTGETKAVDFPVENAFQSSCSLNASRQCAGDAYLAKLNSDGSLNSATYLGGSGEDAGNAIALDAAGNIYIAGATASTDFPVFHPAQATSGGNGDAFVAKISPNGQQVLYATYLGGTDSDEALGIAVDGTGNVYVTGQTLSPDFPTANAFQAHCALGATNQCAGEAFVTKLSSDGSTLAYSTFLGGSGGDSANAIAVDNLGQVYVAGQTLSADFPVAGPLQPASGGKSDAFISKFLPNGGGLVYSTFLGGSGDDVATSIAVDNHGNAFVSGYTDSANFPMQSALQTACQKDSTGACSQDAFLAVMNSGGSALKFSTYLGGTGADEGKGIALDTKGSAYLGGASTSSDFPSAKPIVVPSGVSPVLLQSTSQTANAMTASLAAALPSNLSGGGVVAMISGLPNSDLTEACTGSNNWVGTAGDNQWTTATNWSNGVPVSTDTVCIGTSFATATITVGTISSSTSQTITSLVSNANITFTTGPLTVTSGAMFVNTFSITGGTLTLGGTNGSSVGGTMSQSGGILAGTDTLTITGAFTWTGGYMCTTLTSGACGATTGTQAITNANGGMSIPSTATNYN